jgi:rhomboid protease GluP
LDPNVLLCWLVGLGTAVNALALFLLQRFRTPSWFIVYGFNALLLGGGLLFVPDAAGYATAPIFALTIMCPIWLARAANYAAARLHHAQALRLLQLATLLHPFGLFTQQMRLLKASAAADVGDDDKARSLLEALAAGKDAATADAARMQLLRMNVDFVGLLAFIEADPRRLLDPAYAPAYARAQAETGDLTGALKTVRQAKFVLPEHRAAAELFVAALSGRESFVAALLDGVLAFYPEPVQRYWRATARLASGHPAETLTLPAPHYLKRALEDRRTRGVPPFTLSHDDDAWLALRENEATAIAEQVRKQRGVRRFFTVSTALVLTNLCAFALEIPGGVLDDENLIALGALMLPMHTWTEAWRLLTACFLHWGWLHLLLNLSSLSLFGPTLERSLGKLRFLALYLGAGISSMAAYAVAASLRSGGVIDLYKPPDIVVGASGCIMGVIGGLFALAIVSFWKNRDRPRSVHVIVLGIIVLAQTLFDYFTPQIAMGVHLSGVVVGFVLALVLRDPTSRQ